MKKRIRKEDILDKNINNISTKNGFSDNDIDNRIKEISNTSKKFRYDLEKRPLKNQERQSIKKIGPKVKPLVEIKKPRVIEQKTKKPEITKKAIPLEKTKQKIITKSIELQPKKEIPKRIKKKTISKKVKKNILISIVLIVSILFIAVAIYYSSKIFIPQSNITLGSNIEKATLDYKNNAINIKLPENSRNISSLRFIFKDSSGKEYYYDIDKNNQEFPLNDNNEISITKDDIGVDNIKDIRSVELIIDYIRTGQIIEPIKPPINIPPKNISNNKINNKTKTISNKGSGGSSSGGSSGGSINPTCSPKTCLDIGKSCGSYDNGCGAQIDCGTCDDGYDCTIDSCSTDTGSCLHDDSSCQCNIADDPRCDDGNPCTVDSCNLGTDTCTHTPGNKDATCRLSAGDCDNTEVCDGLTTDCPVDLFKPKDTGCSGNDKCMLYSCNGLGSCDGTPKSCDDGIACTTDSCDPSTGSCLHDDSSCQCNIADDPRCDDGNPCTVDSCNLGTDTCTNTPGNKDATCRLSAGDCDDLEVCDGLTTDCPVDLFKPKDTGCSGNDKCSDYSCNGLGSCDGTPKSCDDGIACTTDSCDPSTGSCLHDDSSCQCNIADDPRCDDGNPCTVDSCNLGTDTCTHTPGNKDATCRLSAGDCDDLEVCDGLSIDCPVDLFKPKDTGCSGNDKCSDYSCNGLGSCDGTPKSCDDGIACTTDSCDSGTGNCNHDDSSCQCNIADDPRCDDGNPCTVDSCNLGTDTCTNTPGNKDATCRLSAGDCDDLEVCDGLSIDCPVDLFKPKDTGCSGNDKCMLYSCNGLGSCDGTPKSCDDGKECTIDSCDTLTGDCKNSIVDQGTSCDNGNGSCDDTGICQPNVLPSLGFFNNLLRTIRNFFGF